MKKPIFLLALIAICSNVNHSIAADDDLFQIADGKEEVQGGSMNPRGFLFVDATAPVSGDADTYINWINTRIEAGKKHWMAYLASQVGHKVSTKCLWHKEAFQFKKLSENDTDGEQYEVACLAGPTSKTLTHALKFKMNVKTLPKGCVPADVMRRYFVTDANRTAPIATAYAHGIVNSSCKISVTHTNYSTGKVIQSAQLLTADSVNNLLQSDSRKELRGIILSSKKAKIDNDGVGNPAHQDAGTAKKVD